MLQLQRISDGVVFDMLGTNMGTRGQLRSDGTGSKCETGDKVWLRYAVGTPLGEAYGDTPYGFGNEFLRNNFTAYPPQGQPDRVDRLAEEVDGREPLQAYRVTFCPVDDKPLEPGHRVVEAYAGALVDAGRCAVCGRFFADDTLTEIKLWKD